MTNARARLVGLRLGVLRDENGRVGADLTNGGWATAETSKHQDHVLAHVIGATVLGYCEGDEALHLFLDIGLAWSIFCDGEMGLTLEAVALADMSLDTQERARLKEELHALHSEGVGAGPLTLARPAPDGCVIEEVELYADAGRRLIVIRGGETGLAVETSAETRGFVVRELSET